MLTRAEIDHYRTFGEEAAPRRRDPVIERMRTAGILGLPGAEGGW